MTRELVSTPTPSAPAAWSELRRWPARRWLVAAATAALVGLVTGVPTDVVPNPFYVRMTPVVWWNYPIWALSAVLAGLVAATYVRAGGAGPTAGAPAASRRAVAGGLLSFLAVGCPVCNKLVVALLGTGAALDYFGPAQPAIGLAGLALLAGTLALRLRGAAACRLPVAPRQADAP